MNETKEQIPKQTLQDETIDSLVSVIHTRLNLTTTASHEFLRLSLKDAMLFDKKQSDYGSRNISQFGMLGVLIRMSDKFERIKHLLTKKKKLIRVKESITDNMTDIANYSKIYRLLDAGKWPEE